MNKLVDLFVIGGGINGAGIARDAAGRGLSVVLCEKDDLAQGTSSRSGKLVHGGLRYLEYYDFRLVREALIEREVLMRAAPHIIWPLRFVLPHSPHDRPQWLIRLGLFLYDHLGGRQKLAGSRSLDLLREPEGAPLKDSFTKGFSYSDCWVDDARLVVLNALDAAERGASILPRHAVVKATREQGRWQIQVRQQSTNVTSTYQARVVVNAAGPWVADVIGDTLQANSSRKVRLVKGSHIVTHKFWAGEHSYLLQNHDKRVIFVNPYQGDKALIGTTDIPFDGKAEDASISDAEVDYLLAAVNAYSKEQLRRSDIVASFSGVRALFDDGQGNPSAVTRDYVFDLDTSDAAPLLNIFGGKITTFRELAERGMQQLTQFFPQMGGNWTVNATLPGGEIDKADYETFQGSLKTDYPWLPRALLQHYGRNYGARTPRIIADATSLEGLGKHFGGNLYEAEVRYLIANEWATTAEDILYRRTKEYLNMDAEQQNALRQWLQDFLQ